VRLASGQSVARTWECDSQAGGGTKVVGLTTTFFCGPSHLFLTIPGGGGGGGGGEVRIWEWCILTWKIKYDIMKID